MAVGFKTYGHEDKIWNLGPMPSPGDLRGSVARDSWPWSTPVDLLEATALTCAGARSSTSSTNRSNDINTIRCTNCSNSSAFVKWMNLQLKGQTWLKTLIQRGQWCKAASTRSSHVNQPVQVSQLITNWLTSLTPPSVKLTQKYVNFRRDSSRKWLFEAQLSSLQIY